MTGAPTPRPDAETRAIPLERPIDLRAALGTPRARRRRPDHAGVGAHRNSRLGDAGRAGDHRDPGRRAVRPGMGLGSRARAPCSTGYPPPSASTIRTTGSTPGLHPVVAGLSRRLGRGPPRSHRRRVGGTPAGDPRAAHHRHRGVAQLPSARARPRERGARPARAVAAAHRPRQSAGCPRGRSPGWASSHAAARCCGESRGRRRASRRSARAHGSPVAVAAVRPPSRRRCKPTRASGRGPRRR